VADGINWFGKIVHTANKNTEPSVLASKVMQDRIAIKRSIMAPLKAGTFEILGKTLTTQSCFQEEIKSKFNSGNACCHSVQNTLCSRFYPEM